MRIVVAGASGFLGTHLVDDLRVHGHEVVRLVRRPPAAAEESRWDPQGGVVDPEVVSWSHVVVNLAGSPLVGNPHSSRWAREIRTSRVATTSTLAAAVAACGQPPALLAGNGISWYGDHGGEVVTEESDSRGTALLSSVTRDWEAATGPAVAAGARVCVLRTSPVMDGTSAPLKYLRTLFSLGLGGRIGDGEQHMPMVSLRDWVGAVRHLTESREASGPFNICCDEAPTNAEFTEALARAVGRKPRLPVPATVVEKAAGPMAPEVLGSINARPAALERDGFEIQDPDVESVLAAALA